MAERVRIKDVAPKKDVKFKKGHEKVGGRQPGSQNKVSVLLKDALIKAAEAEGLDRKGKDGLIGYLRMLSRREPAVYGRLLEKLLPYQLTGKDGGPMQLTHTTKEQVVERMKERGLPVPQSLMAAPTHKPPNETAH
jgi:hypothetical protein